MDGTFAERAASRSPIATVRIIRSGEVVPGDEPDDGSPSERMAAVWRLRSNACPGVGTKRMNPDFRDLLSALDAPVE